MEKQEVASTGMDETYPVQVAGCGIGAVAVAIRHVDHHGADVVRPGVVPVSSDTYAGVDRSGELRVNGGSGIIAANVGINGTGDGATQIRTVRESN